MEMKIVYLTLLQFVLTLAFIWQLLSLRQFCGTFADPKAFIHDISIGHCKSFTLIGKDSKSGEFGVVFNEQKLHDQLLLMSSTNGQPTEEQQHQFMDELATKLPSAGRHCIPITISPFDWIGMLYRNLLNNDILLHFSFQLFYALLSLVLLGLGTVAMLQFEEGVELSICCFAFGSVIAWCVSAVFSSNLLLYWTDFWTCVNFQADQTNLPLITLVLSIVLACSPVFEIFCKISLMLQPLPKPFTTNCAIMSPRNVPM